MIKQDEKKLRQCINGVEYEGSAYFGHKVKVKWMSIRFHVRALADP